MLEKIKKILDYISIPIIALLFFLLRNKRREVLELKQDGLTKEKEVAVKQAEEKTQSSYLTYSKLKEEYDKLKSGDKK